jgi:tyrosinase
MIDRLFAIWQALYPDSYIEPGAQTQGSYWYNEGDVLDGNSGRASSLQTMLTSSSA